MVVGVGVCIVRVGRAVRVPQGPGRISGVVGIVRDAVTVPGMEMRMRSGGPTGDRRQDEETAAQTRPHTWASSVVPQETVKAKLDTADAGNGASPEMHRVFWSGVLTVAILAGMAAPRQLHLHAANGVRATHDDRHRDGAGQPLLHSHAAPHGHDDSQPEGGEREDVLAVADGVLAAKTLHAADPLMVPSRPVALSPPVTVHRPLIVHQPPSHAPPIRSAVGTRGPPPAIS